MQGTGKTEEVIRLLQHLPYIVNKPFSAAPHALPGCWAFDWATTGTQLTTGKAHPGNMLSMSEGMEDQFGGRVPNYCIGLMYGRRDQDIVLLDTRDGLIYWMVCPEKVLESSSPKPSFLVHPFRIHQESVEIRTKWSKSQLRTSEMKHLRMKPSLVILG
jgi:hypothetical protein